MASNSRRFGSLTDCIAKRAERQPYGEQLPALRFTYLLHCKASRTSAIWRATPGDSVHLPTALQSEPNVSHMASNSRRCGSLTSCIVKRAERQPYGEQLPAIRFTYRLHCKASRTSAIWRATPGAAVHLPSALQSEPNVSHMASNSRRFGSLTDCIAK